MVRNNSSRGQRNSYGLIDRREYLRLTGASTGFVVGGLGAGGFGSTPVRAASTVLDDFEDGDMNEYSGSTAGYTVQSSTVLEGSYSLECNDAYERLGYTTDSTTRGNEYKCRVMAPSGGPTPLGLLVGVQNPDFPFNDCYCTFVNVPNDRLSLLKKEGGNNNWLDGVDISLSDGTEYIAGLRYDSSTVQAVVYDSSGTELASTNSVSDGTYSGGTFGFYCGSDVPGYFDYVREEPMGEQSSDESYEFEKIDDFELSNLSKYSFDRGESGASVVRDPVYDGPNPFGPSYSGMGALEISNSNTELISLPGDGLENYPSSGEIISCYIMATDGGGKLNLTYGVQNHTNRYYVHVDFNDDELMVLKYDGGTARVLGSQTSDFSLSEDTWYWVEVHWETDSTHTVELYDIRGNTLAECAGTDSEWTSGGIGYDAYLSSTGGTVYFDTVRIGEDTTNKGGWGPITEPSYNRNERDDTWERVEDFTFLFDTTGHVEDNPNYYVFTVGALAQTYQVDEDVATHEASTEQLAPIEGIDNINHEIRITDSNGNRVGDTVQLSENLGKIGFTYFDTTEWGVWIDEDLGEGSTQDEILQAAIDNSALDPVSGQGSVSFSQGLQALLGVASIGLRGTVISPFGTVAALLLTGAEAALALTQESDCGYSETANPDYDSRTWDACKGSPLSAYVASYTLYVPDDLEVNVEVDQNVALTNTAPNRTPNTMHWRPTVQTDHTIDLDSNDYWLEST